MNSYVTGDFHACFDKLPVTVKEQARKIYRRWENDPYYPSLHFKRVHQKEKIYSVRIGIGWRALGLVKGNSITWFWIGSHADYDKMLSGL